jgi:hypothetical protein
MARKVMFQDPYKFMFGVLDKRTNTVLFQVKGLNKKQAELAWKELKLKY